MSIAVNTPIDEETEARNAGELSKLQDLLFGPFISVLEDKFSVLENRIKAQSAAQSKSYEALEAKIEGLEAKIEGLEAVFSTRQNETERRFKKEFNACRKGQTEAMSNLKFSTSEIVENLKSRLESLEKNMKTELAKKINQKE